ncbi:MAG: EAL domain-containing protein [Gammaproteobacteria bacterium]|nr:EAL domain-containing protein [Gammaproteobacteria bacterium]
MTLFRQVALLVSFVYLLIVITTTISDFKRSGDFVDGQLQTTAQDMATTLGIAISNSSSVSDMAAYETLFNAVFDSGYYTSIKLISPDGEIILKKSQELKMQGVPDWFLSLVSLNPATGVSEVMQGWVSLGTLELTLHPGYIYTNFYQKLKSTFIWFGVWFLVGMIVLWMLLHKLLKPLNEVKQQADAIHSNRFVKQSTIPRTRELKSVVIAMNRMIEKVNAIFDDQQETLTNYQKLLYEDALTGLSNRKYFFTQLAQAQLEESSFHGSMVVIKINNLDYVRDNSGYEKADEIIEAMAKILKEDAANYANEQCARLTDDEFSILIPSDEQTVVNHVNDIFVRYKLAVDMSDEVFLIAGVTSVAVGSDIGETLANSDFALQQAAVGGSYSISEKISSDIDLPQGKMQWRAWLEECILAERFFLVGQNVVDNKNEAIHQEVFVRLKNDSNQVVSAGLFMPMANALGIGENIDRVVFNLVKQLSENNTDIPIALNLTESVFSHADALIEFNQLLTYFQQSNSKVCIEASHAILEKYSNMCVEVSETIKKSGNVFGIDNLNLSLSLQSLQKVRPDYVKMSAKTLYDMTQSEMSPAFQALHTVTRTMDIELIAVGVDSQEVFDHLKALGVTTMQGNFLSKPKEFV